jgi:hypothetical protein
MEPKMVACAFAASSMAALANMMRVKRMGFVLEPRQNWARSRS